MGRAESRQRSKKVGSLNVHIAAPDVGIRDTIIGVHDEAAADGITYVDAYSVQT
jgi:hypothetical protein